MEAPSPQDPSQHTAPLPVLLPLDPYLDSNVSTVVGPLRTMIQDRIVGTSKELEDFANVYQQETGKQMWKWILSVLI